MTSRDDVFAVALKGNGLGNGQGYGTADEATRYLGRPAEYSCCDHIAYWYAVAGLPLPYMQPGMAHGSCSCPLFLNYARGRKSPRKGSWLAERADAVLFDWNGDGVADHIELVDRYDPYAGLLWTIGGDSGPSNVDGYRGEGGVHRHTWHCPPGVGNSLILAVVDMSCLVTFDAKHAATTPSRPKKAGVAAAAAVAVVTGGGAVASHQAFTVPEHGPVVLFPGYATPTPTTTPALTPKPSPTSITMPTLGGVHPSSQSYAASIQLRKAQTILRVPVTGHSTPAGNKAFGMVIHAASTHRAQIDQLRKLYGLPANHKGDAALHTAWDHDNYLAGAP